jgi:hypothetical protein
LERSGARLLGRGGNSIRFGSRESRDRGSASGALASLASRISLGSRTSRSRASLVSLVSLGLESLGSLVSRRSWALGCLSELLKWLGTATSGLLGRLDGGGRAGRFLGRAELPFVSLELLSCPVLGVDERAGVEGPMGVLLLAGRSLAEASGLAGKESLDPPVAVCELLSPISLPSWTSPSSSSADVVLPVPFLRPVSKAALMARVSVLLTGLELAGTLEL